MPEPFLFWLTVLLFSAAVVVGALALSRMIRFMAELEPGDQSTEEQRRIPPPTATA